jgi:hypothetical protein
MTATKFEAQLPLVNEVVAFLESLRPRETVSVVEIANGLNRSRNEIITLFDVLNIQPGRWDEPSDYEIAAILESCSRHEVSARFNP